MKRLMTAWLIVLALGTMVRAQQTLQTHATLSVTSAAAQTCGFSDVTLTVVTVCAGTSSGINWYADGSTPTFNDGNPLSASSCVTIAGAANVPNVKVISQGTTTKVYCNPGK